MEVQNNSNLPAVQSKSKFKQFMKKLQKPLYIFMTTLGIVIPYADQVADMQKPPPVDNNRMPINEVMKQDQNAKYEQAFNNMGIKVDFENKMEMPEDGPPEPEYNTAPVENEVKITYTPKDEYPDLVGELKKNVKDISANAVVNKFEQYKEKSKDNKSKNDNPKDDR